MSRKGIECVCGHVFNKELVAKEVGGNIMTLKEAGKPAGYFGNAAKQMIPVKCPECERVYLAALGRHYNGYKILGLEHEGNMFTQGKIQETEAPETVEEKPVVEDAKEVKEEKAPETAVDVDMKSMLMVKILDITDKKELIEELKAMGVPGLKGQMNRQTIIKLAKDHFGIGDDFQA